MTTPRVLPDWRDPLIAASLLTRFPVPVDHARAGARMGVALWSAPIVGAVVGAMTGVVLWAGLTVGLPPLAAAAVAVAAGLWFTGGLHEDGLADTIDGLSGGRTPERRLEIMRDSRVGSHGAAALCLALLGRVALMAALDPSTAVAGCAAAGAASRVAMVAALRWMPPARPGGLGAAATGVPAWGPWLALLSAVATSVAIGATPFDVAVALLPALVLARLALRRIGGQTGDILGAMQVTGEIAALAAFSRI
jgi:adenosylcobinamide-GDP ribazoletransferase